MKICFLSDIHGNYDALKKCVKEAKKLNIKILKLNLLDNKINKI